MYGWRPSRENFTGFSRNSERLRNKATQDDSETVAEFEQERRRQAAREKELGTSSEVRCRLQSAGSPLLV